MDLLGVKEGPPSTLERNAGAFNSRPDSAPQPSIRIMMMASRQAEVDLDFDENDPENPRTFSTAKKALIAFTLLISSFIAYVLNHTYFLADLRYSNEVECMPKIPKVQLAPPSTSPVSQA
jgi:hypothetical protein